MCALHIQTRSTLPAKRARDRLKLHRTKTVDLINVFCNCRRIRTIPIGSRSSRDWLKLHRSRLRNQSQSQADRDHQRATNTIPASHGREQMPPGSALQSPAASIMRLAQKMQHRTPSSPSAGLTLMSPAVVWHAVVLARPTQHIDMMRDKYKRDVNSRCVCCP